MRILLKILLFPVVIVLTIGVLILRFLHGASTMILGILSGIFVLTALGTWVFKMGGFAMFQQYSGMDILGFLVIAFVLSPYGLPLITGILIELIDVANGAIKAI